jgi:hypothetical protein
VRRCKKLGTGGNYMICTLHEALFGRNGEETWHVWERREICIVFWWGSLKERDNLDDLGRDGRVILRYSSIP